MTLEYCQATGKRCLTRDEAERLAKRARQRTEDYASPYKCRSCDRWHFGSTDFPSPEVRRRKRR